MADLIRSRRFVRVVGHIDGLSLAEAFLGELGARGSLSVFRGEAGGCGCLRLGLLGRFIQVIYDRLSAYVMVFFALVAQGI